MSSADYFPSNSTEPERTHRHRSGSTRHRKHHRSRSDYASDSDSPVEQIVEETQYYDPLTGNSTKIVDKTEYRRDGSRRRHRHRSELGSSDDDATATRSRSRRHRSSRKSRGTTLLVGEEGYIAPPQPAYPGDISTSSPTDYTRESGYISGPGSRSPSPRRRERRKSVGETALAAIGLAGVAEKIKDKKEEKREALAERADRNRSQHRDGRHGRSRKNEEYTESETESEDEDPNRGKKNAGQAAILAAAVEAWRARKEPGGLTGPAALKRIVEAAIASGALEGFLGRHGEGDHAKRHIIESVIGGLGAQRTLNGPRERSGGTVRDLAGSALILGAGKKLFDQVEDKRRSRSASRPRSDRSSRRGSEYAIEAAPSSGGRSRRDRPAYGRQRSHSAGDLLGAIGLGGAAAAAREEYDKYKYGDPDRRRDRRRDSDTRSRDAGSIDGSSSGSRDIVLDSDTNSNSGRRSRRSVDDYAPSTRGDSGAVVAAYPVDADNQVATTSSRSSRSKKNNWKEGGSSSESDLTDMDSEDERERIKTLKRNEFLGVALAVIGSLNAAASIYEGKQKRAKRIEELKSGKITPGEAKKKKTKAQVKDVATVGLAVLGAVEAYNAWKEMYENRKELHEFKEKCQVRRKKRRERSMNDNNSNNAPQIHYIMPPPGTTVVPTAGNPYPVEGTAAEGIEPTATYYQAGNPTDDPAVAMGYPPGLTYAQQQALYEAQEQAKRQQQQQYTTRDGRAVPVVYPTSVRDA